MTSAVGSHTPKLSHEETKLVGSLLAHVSGHNWVSVREAGSVGKGGANVEPGADLFWVRLGAPMGRSHLVARGACDVLLALPLQSFLCNQCDIKINARSYF